MPTVFSLLTIAPITFALIYFAQGNKDLDYAISYRHLWFLVTLSIISLLMCINPEKIIKVIRVFSERNNKSNTYIAIISLCIIVTLFELFSRIANYALPSKLGYILQISSTLKFLGYFIVGMIIYFWDRNLNKKLISFALILFALWYLVKCMDIPAYKYILAVTKPTITVLLCLAVFYFF